MHQFWASWGPHALGRISRKRLARSLPSSFAVGMMDISWSSLGQRDVPAGQMPPEDSLICALSSFSARYKRLPARSPLRGGLCRAGICGVSRPHQRDH